MNIKEARLYLEHTSKDDFNLEEWQKENRYQAIQVILKENERLEKENTILRQNSQYLVKQKDELEEELERLNNVFDELKERIKNNIQYDDNIDNFWTTTNEMFKILDKIGDDKE